MTQHEPDHYEHQLRDATEEHEDVSASFALEAFLAVKRTAERDAARYRWLRDTFHAAKGGAHLTVNDHLAYYEPSEPGKEVQVQWYPDTPIGSHSVYGATMDEAIDAARAPGDSR